MAAGQTTQGRVRTDVDPETHLPPDSAKGDYWRDAGVWYGWCPTPGPRNLLCSLETHKITEHEDGTITVDPSILTRLYDGTVWHGWLRRGVWMEV